jgi:ribonuclease Z
MPPSFRIQSCWSKAGVGTCIVLDYQKTNSIVLDLGATPNYGDTLRSGVVLLTHGHLDHVGAIFSHARAYSLMHSNLSATYYVPLELVPLLERAKACMDALDVENRAGASDKSGLKMNFIGVTPGDEFDLPIKKHLKGETIFIRVFETFHGQAPSVGYVIGVRQKESLKEEYKGLPGHQLRELAISKVNIKESIESLEVAYTGDTTVETFQQQNTIGDKSALHLEQAFQCQYFLTESTMLDNDEASRSKAHSMGHMHVQDVVQAVVPRVRHVLVLLHISGRYEAKLAMQLIASAIPSSVTCLVAVSSLDRVMQHFGRLVPNNGLWLVSAYQKHQHLQIKKSTTTTTPVVEKSNQVIQRMQKRLPGNGTIHQNK